MEGTVWTAAPGTHQQLSRSNVSSRCCREPRTESRLTLAKVSPTSNPRTTSTKPWKTISIIALWTRTTKRASLDSWQFQTTWKPWREAEPSTALESKATDSPSGTISTKLLSSWSGMRKRKTCWALSTRPRSMARKSRTPPSTVLSETGASSPLVDLTSQRRIPLLM